MGWSCTGKEEAEAPERLNSIMELFPADRSLSAWRDKVTGSQGPLQGWVSRGTKPSSLPISFDAWSLH